MAAIFIIETSHLRRTLAGQATKGDNIREKATFGGPMWVRHPKVEKFMQATSGGSMWARHP